MILWATWCLLVPPSPYISAGDIHLSNCGLLAVIFQKKKVFFLIWNPKIPLPIKNNTARFLDILSKLTFSYEYPVTHNKNSYLPNSSILEMAMEQVRLGIGIDFSQFETVLVASFRLLPVSKRLGLWYFYGYGFG